MRVDETITRGQVPVVYVFSLLPHVSDTARQTSLCFPGSLDKSQNPFNMELKQGFGKERKAIYHPFSILV